MARIVINPTTFQNKKDALCVAFDEGFRILMEHMGFVPAAEPTNEQRKFFADTAYAKDETQLRRTILARICTLDTSVEYPTDEQLQEAREFLDSVLEIGAPKSEWEQKCVKRLRDLVAAIPPSMPRAEPKSAQPGISVASPAAQAAEKAGDTDKKIVTENGTETTEAEAQQAADQAKADLTGSEQPTDRPIGEEKPAEEKPAEEKPAEETPAEETPAAPAPEQPTADMGSLTINIGASVGISDSGVKGRLNRIDRRGPVQSGRIEDLNTRELVGGPAANHPGRIENLNSKELLGGPAANHPGRIENLNSKELVGGPAKDDPGRIENQNVKKKKPDA